MLTQRQREVYEFVVSYTDSHGYPPTVREIGEAVGLASPSTVHAHLANLERAGYLRRDPTKPRALELTKRERTAAGASVSVPDVGEVRAPARWRDRRRRAAPRRGERGGSSGGAGHALARRRGVLAPGEGREHGRGGILHGDYVVVQRQQTARDGDIVVALAGQDEAADEATVKRFFRERAGCACSPRTPRWSRSTPSTSASSARSSACSGGWVEDLMTEVVTLNRTLDQELMALMRGASLECPACGEFVLHRDDAIECPECGSGLRNVAAAALRLGAQAG